MRMDTTVTPTSDTDRLQRQQAVVKALLRVLPERSVLWQTEAVTPFECDGLSAYRQRPLAVALPETHEQVGAASTCRGPWGWHWPVWWRIA